MLLITETLNLLREIHDVIEDYVMNEVTLETAKEEYVRLDGIFYDLCNRYLPERGNKTTGLFHFHNAVNFCKLTCMLHADGSPVEQAYAGDISLVGMLKENQVLASYSNYSHILHEDGDYCLTLHLLPVESHGGGYIASITSSPFFNISYFRNLPAILQVLTEAKGTESIAIDYFSNVSHDLINYVNNETLKGNIIYGELIVFNAVEKIFGHAGFDALRTMTKEFTVKIMKSHDVEPIVFTLSFDSYVAIHSFPEKTALSEKQRIMTSRYDFTFRDITLPFRRSIIQIDNSQSVHSLLEQLYLIEKQGRNNSGS